MKFLHYEFDLSSSDVVVVTLDRQANVILLDDLNFSRFKRGEQYTYHGGFAKTSPVRLSPPHAGHWNVVINLGGYTGTVRASVHVLKGSTVS